MLYLDIFADYLRQAESRSEPKDVRALLIGKILANLEWNQHLYKTQIQTDNDQIGQI